MSPKDYFSGQAAGYAAFRPTYPAELFAFVASLAPARDITWDCATGSGQAAVALAAHFAEVVATDVSAAQLAHAAPHARVTYQVAPAEASGLADASVALVTVAQALHWFDLDAFYAEVRRVLVPGGAIAVWSYGDPVLGEPALDAPFRAFARDVVGPYWPPERQLVGEGYRHLPFPFAEVDAPGFTLERACTLPEYAGYLRTWSATARYRAATGRDPVDAFEREIAPRWGPPARTVTVRWPLALRAARVTFGRAADRP